MKITVLGCGNAFSTKNGNNCFLLEDSERTYTEVEGAYGSSETVKGKAHRRMLVDAGWALPYMLKRGNVDINTITDVYISHAHADHIGGLEFLGFSRYDWLNKPAEADINKGAISLYANSKLMEELWDNSLKGGMSSLEGLDATLKTYFYPVPILPNQGFVWCGWKCSLIQQIHIMTGSIITNTFGLFMEKEGHPSVYFVTDSQHCSPRQIEIFYRKADIILQDCECIGVDMKEKKSVFMSGVHANYAQLAGWESANSVRLPSDIKKKMWLTHYQDFVGSNDFFGNKCDWDAQAEADGFAGFMYVGQVVEV